MKTNKKYFFAASAAVYSLTIFVATASPTSPAASEPVPQTARGIAAARHGESPGGCVVKEPKMLPLDKGKNTPKLSVKSYEDVFAAADSNKDGKLSKDEFQKAYIAIIQQQKAKP